MSESKKTKLLSLREAGARCGVAATTIGRRTGVFGELSLVRLNGRVLVIESELDALIERLVTEARANHPCRRADEKLRSLKLIS